MIGRANTDGGSGSKISPERMAAVGNALILLPCALLVLVFLVRSMGWRTEHDVPLAHYSAFMHATFGTKPYQELFEISFPGTILVHLAITRVFGYGDRGVMLANALWFVALSGVAGYVMSRFGRAVAAGAVVLFGVAYFASGPGMMLQRDCLLILPVMLGLALHIRQRGAAVPRRAAIGLLVGAAAAIKPHAAVALLPIIVDELAPVWCGAAAAGTSLAARVRPTLLALVAYGAGFAVPWVLVFAWLASTGGFAAWLEMSRQYLPLYLHMTGKHETIQGAARLANLVRGFISFGGQAPWFLAAGVGVFGLLSRLAPSSPQARLARLLLGEAAVFAVYPVFAGQFWPYHYIPFVFFITQLAALCLMALPPPRRLGETLAPKVALAIALLCNGPLVDAASRMGGRDRAQAGKTGEVDEMADFLKVHLAPGDTVQPLDWTGGAVHAMLIARARLATRFMYDYHFYHHVSNPFVQTLRQRVMTELTAAPPRFVVEYFGENKPWPEGKDTTRDFPVLQRFLADNYRVELARPSFRIYERTAGTK